MEGTVVARLLRGGRPPTVRSTEADARPKPRRERERAGCFERERRRRGCAEPRCAMGGTAKNVEATLAEARTASDR